MNQLQLDYKPREAFVAFHQRSERFAAMVCHRRAGKTVACVHDLVLRAMYTKKKRAKYAYVGPQRQQAKDIAWEYLKDATQHIRKGAPRESDLRVTLFNGATIGVYGADNPDSLRGLYFDGAIIDEYGDCRPSLWGEILLPTLIDRKGWAVFIGTMKGKNHFFKTLERAKREDSWFYMVLKGSESGILDQEDLLELRDQLSEAEYAAEIECDPDAAVRGTYYADLITKSEKAGRIGSYPYDPTLQVHVSADIGFTDSSAWWFWQIDEDGPVLIDYYENDSVPLAHYFEMLREKDYDYADIWLPHDAKAKSFQTGRSTIEQFKLEKLPVKPVPKLDVQHGIDAARMVLPKVRIDQKKCFTGIEALRAYRRQWNEKTQQFSNAPLHDWASNGSDSFRYFALVTEEHLPVTKVEDEKEIDLAPKYTLDDLFAARDKDRWRTRIIRL